MNLIEESIVLHLNSKDAHKENGNFNSDLLFDVGGIFVIENTDNVVYSEVSVLNAEIPNSWYIIDYRNNVLNYILGEDTFSFVVPEGKYTATVLIIALTDGFLSHTHNVVITLSKLNGKLTIQNLDTTLGELSLLPSTIQTVLGFDEEITTVSFVMTLPYPLNIMGYTFLKVCSNHLIVSNTDTKIYGILCGIPVNVPSYHLVRYLNNANTKSVLNQSSNLSQLSIKLFGNDDSFVNLNNQEWTISIKLTHYKFQTFRNP